MSGASPRASELGAQFADRQVAAQQRAGQPGDAAQIGHRGRHDVDAAVRIVDPVDRHLGDAQPAALGQHQQFGVEEPRRVAHVRQQRLARTRPASP